MSKIATRRDVRDWHGRFAKGRNLVKRIKKECLNCKQEFEIPETKNKKYCSRNCFYIYIHNHKKVKKIKTFACKHCKKVKPNKSGRKIYCEDKICQSVRKKIVRERFKKTHGDEYLRVRHKEWSRKQGIMPRGQSCYEEQIYKKLLKYFKAEDIQRNVYKVIRNPYTAGYFELDFYIEKFKLAFEVDGESHRQSNSYGQERLDKQIINDYLKELACEEKGITLMRIPMGKDINLWGQLGFIDLNILNKFLCQLIVNKKETLLSEKSQSYTKTMA